MEAGSRWEVGGTGWRGGKLRSVCKINEENVISIKLKCSQVLFPSLMLYSSCFDLINLSNTSHSKNLGNKSTSTSLFPGGLYQKPKQK